MVVSGAGGVVVGSGAGGVVVGSGGVCEVGGSVGASVVTGVPGNERRAEFGRGYPSTCNITKLIVKNGFARKQELKSTKIQQTKTLKMSDLQIKKASTENGAFTESTFSVVSLL